MQWCPPSLSENRVKSSRTYDAKKLYNKRVRANFEQSFRSASLMQTSLDVYFYDNPCLERSAICNNHRYPGKQIVGNIKTTTTTTMTSMSIVHGLEIIVVTCDAFILVTGSIRKQYSQTCRANWIYHQDRILRCNSSSSDITLSTLSLTWLNHHLKTIRERKRSQQFYGNWNP